MLTAEVRKAQKWREVKLTSCLCCALYSSASHLLRLRVIVVGLLNFLTWFDCCCDDVLLVFGIHGVALREVGPGQRGHGDCAFGETMVTVKVAMEQGICGRQWSWTGKLLSTSTMKRSGERLSLNYYLHEPMLSARPSSHVGVSSRSREKQSKAQ
jgi:hypothetical protein